MFVLSSAEHKCIDCHSRLFYNNNNNNNTERVGVDVNVPSKSAAVVK